MGMDGVEHCCACFFSAAGGFRVLPQAMTLVPIALLLLLDMSGWSVRRVHGDSRDAQHSVFGFWGAALSAVLLVPILVVSSYMVEHEQSFWQSAAGPA
ncbi:MAG: hypothetical protein ACLS7Z_08000 [Christensenellales bacterium]